MIPRRRPRATVRSLLLSALLAASAPVINHAALTDTPATVAKTPDPLDRINHLPESNPYRAALAAYLSLPASDREALGSWTTHRAPDDTSPPATLTAQQQTVARQLAQALAQTASAPATSAADWPVKRDPNDPDDPYGVTVPEIGVLRDLARITTKVAADSPPGEATALYAATARLGREARQGITIIRQLTGVAIEDIAQGDVARRLGEFSPAELEALSSAWASLPLAPDGMERCLATERESFFRPIVEDQLLPGALAYFAAGEPATDAEDDATPDPNIDRLRLSALVDFGDGDKQITLENLATGEFFTVTPRRPAEGVELVGFDIPGRRAHIRVHGRDATINLQTKEIVSRSDALKKFLLLLKQMRFAGESDESGGASASPPMTMTRQAWLAPIKNHPGGPEGYFADALARYDANMKHQIAEAELPAVPDSATPPPGALAPGTDPIVELLTPPIGKVARTIHTFETGTVMLEAAIRHRLGQTDRAPADPWAPATDDASAAPFTYEPTPDGGFTLVSRYQRNRDEPVTYKFAAPDAGIVRKK